MAERYQVGTTYECNDKEITNINQLTDKKYHFDVTPEEVKYIEFGDIISFGTYRDVCSMIVSFDGELIPNEDYSSAGYLTIPLEITSEFSDAHDHYRQLIKKRSVALTVSGKDLYAQRLFGGLLPEEVVFILDFNKGSTSPSYLVIEYAPGVDESYDDPDEFPDAEEINENYYMIQRALR